MIGGAGNDKLWGDTTLRGEDSGSGTFVYTFGDGKDTVYYFGQNDMLQLSGVTIEDIIVNPLASNGSLELTLNKDYNNTITLSQYQTNTFNINGDEYEVKGTGLYRVTMD